MFLVLLLLTVPQVMAKDPHEIKREELVDDYHWLKNRESLATLRYLERENLYTEKMMASTEELQKRLYMEMKERLEECDSTVPIPKGEYFYYQRFEEGKSYTLHCRKKGAKEEIFLDENELASDYAYFSLNSLSLNHDQTKVVFGYDTNGNETNTLRIKDLKTGELLPDTIHPQVGKGVLAQDGKTLFYVVPDRLHRPYRVYQHVLGQDPKDDVLIFEERDPKFVLTLKKSKDEKVLFIRSKGRISSVVYTIDLEHLDALKLLHPYKEGVKYYAESFHNAILILTNENAPNFKLVSLEKGKMQEIVRHRPEIFIEKMEVFQDGVALFERENFRQQIEWINFTTGCSTKITFQEPTYRIWREKDLDISSPYLRFHYTSLVTPESVYDFEFSTGKFYLRKQEKVKKYCPCDYVEQFFFIKACDGRKVPISLVYKKDVPINGLLLTGYGAYGQSYPLRFSSKRLSLLDRGVVYAIAHIRGGGEGGRSWYEEGRLLNKKTTFTDFISSAEGLIERQITDPSHLVIQGKSAGGLLMGAVVNMRPDLFRAVIAEVPFVDVLNTMSDPTIPLTVNEYDEWGNPQDERIYHYMKSYSPYDNVEEKNYPALLVTAGMSDPRVGYWEPAKWVAKLRTKKKNSDLLLLKTNMNGGHFGTSDRYDALKEEAFKYAFILEMLKVKNGIQ